jgi:hypothetical protein
MKDPERSELLATLDGTLQLESNSFIRYLVESADAHPGDEFEREVLRVSHEWYRATEQSCRALRDYLAEADYSPSDGSWPLHFAQYNFLAPAYLLKTVIRHMGPHLEKLRVLSQGITDPDARDLLTAIYERQRPFLGQMETLDAKRPRAATKAPNVRGTSASRW